MNNERYNQIVDEVYEKYINSLFYNFSGEVKGYLTHFHLTREEFINKCKTDLEFSEKWGLKIEERELSNRERNEWFQIHLNGNNPFMKSDWKDFELDQQNISTKLLTIIYKDTKIEVYE